MRYRRQDSNGDYVFGHSSQDFLVNTPETVGQAVGTGLRLFAGEYFVDTSKGVNWQNQVVGRSNAFVYDQLVKAQILSTPGVVGPIVAYSSSVSNDARVLTVAAQVNTIYGGPVAVAVALPTASGYGAGPYGGQPGYGA